MRKYELIYVIAPDIDEEGQATLQNKLTGIVEQGQGQVAEIKEWGKQRLAYEINDHREGIYTEIHFSGDGDVVAELDRIIKITEGFLRHIVVRREE